MGSVACTALWTLGFAVPLVLAFFYSYPFNATGSVIPCIMLHASFTAAQDNLTLIADESHGVTDVAIGLAYLAGAVVVVAISRGRLGPDSSVTGSSSHPVEGTYVDHH